MCAVFFNIYGMKLNEGYVSSATVINYFWDKPYQEIDFISHLNSVLLMARLILPQFTCLCPLLQWKWYFSILWPMKNDVIFE